MPTYYAPGTRKGNRTFVVRGYIDGRRYEIATDATTQEVAEEEWVEWRRTVRAGYPVSSRETLTFEEAVRLYEDARRPGKREQKFIDRLKKHFGRQLVSTIRNADITAAAHSLYPNCIASTKNRQVVAPTAAILHYAAENDLADHVVVKRLKESDPHRPIARPEDLADLINATKGAPRAILITLQRQGWRITETLAIKRENVDFERLLVRRLVSKSRKWRWTPLAPDVVEAWKTLPARPDGYLFPYRSRQNFMRAIRPTMTTLGMKWSPHRSRRGFATALIEEGADLESIRVAGCWEDIKSVVTYADADVRQARKTIDRIGNRVAPKPRKKRRKTA